jgi:hypothetical protein
MQSATASPAEATKAPFGCNPPADILYQPGELKLSNTGLLLSKGLDARIFARSNASAVYRNGTESARSCHQNPDGAATFKDVRAVNPGGWIYVSNSEDRTKTRSGGVGAFTFDKDGGLVDYRVILEGTESNCNGGATSWGAWISCEETEGGRVWQVDPTGERQPGVITLGEDGGQFEAYAHTADNQYHFVTEDDERGALRRFRPDSLAGLATDPWNMLYGPGKTDFLVLNPDAGTFEWTSDELAARDNAEKFYPGSEGMVIQGCILYFVSYRLKTLFALNLQDMVYTTQSTINGDFEGEPDAIQTIQDDIDLLLFTEDNSTVSGVYGRDSTNKFYTILEAQLYPNDETTGLALSPNHRHLYFALQKHGLFFDVTRKDGLPFEAETLRVKYINGGRRREKYGSPGSDRIAIRSKTG